MDLLDESTKKMLERFIDAIANEISIRENPIRWFMLRSRKKSICITRLQLKNDIVSAAKDTFPIDITILEESLLLEAIEIFFLGKMGWESKFAGTKIENWPLLKLYKGDNDE